MEGKFSFANAQEDIEAALEFLRDPENQAKNLVDPNRLTLIGFSMGAWLALLVGARDPAVACVGSLDMGNMALNGQLGISASKLAGGFEQRVGPETPINGNALALAEELIAHAKDWDPSSHAEALRERPILLLSTEGNPGHDLLLTALRDVRADRVTEIIWQTDHLFSDRRIALSHAVVDWFRTSCDP
jgi:pimeloyl-ACP methyl ester carboxylesterase